MSFRIVKPGILDTIQDTGRIGYSKWGINPGGVMDGFASAVANALVGNTENDPLLEIHFPSCEIEFNQTCLVAITGGDFSAFAGNEILPTWKPILIPAGTTLSFRRKIFGERAYLAINGRWRVDQWLKSSSTNLKIEVGGVSGRKLKSDDVVKIESTYSKLLNTNIIKLPWSASFKKIYSEPEIIRFVRGNEFGWIDEYSQKEITTSSVTIAPSSDRMGYQLKHRPLSFRQREELLSSAVSFGTIQILPNGSAIILMADHQTTGGYPRLGYVIGADLSKLAQLGSGKEFRFKEVTANDSEKLLISLKRDIINIQRSCLANLKSYNA